jgi:hypothetical protein
MTPIHEEIDARLRRMCEEAAEIAQLVTAHPECIRSKNLREKLTGLMAEMWVTLGQFEREKTSDRYGAR